VELRVVELEAGGSDVVPIKLAAVVVVDPDVESDVAGTTTVVTK
jgi:hypothetical protein